VTLLLGVFPSRQSSIFKGCSDHKCKNDFLGGIRKLWEKKQQTLLRTDYEEIHMNLLLISKLRLLL